jgi:hypothetical protein
VVRNSSKGSAQRFGFGFKVQKVAAIFVKRDDTIKARAWSYQQKFSDLRNFQKKSENFKPTIFVRKV